MKGVLLAMLCLLAASVSQPSTARAIRCNACSETAAAQLALQAGRGRHYVYDLHHRHVVAFDVVWDAELRRFHVEPAEVEPEVQDVVDALSDYHAETGGVMAKTIEVRADELGVLGLGGASAYDVIDDQNLRARIGDRLAQHGIPAGTTAQAINRIIQLGLSTAVGPMGFTDGVAVYILVRFIDGTSVTFKVVPGNPHAEYQHRSGRNEEGDALLEANGPEYTGLYRFNSAMSLQQFLDRARMLGIPITGGGTGNWRCTWDGRTVSCVRTSN